MKIRAESEIHMATRASTSRKPSTRTKAKATRATKSRAPKTKATSAGRTKAAQKTPVEKPVVAAAVVNDASKRVRRSDLLTAVAEKVPLKRSDVKLVMDAMLSEMGAAMDDADQLVLPPLGKVIVKKRVGEDGPKILTLKLKRAAPR